MDAHLPDLVRSRLDQRRVTRASPLAVVLLAAACGGTTPKDGSTGSGAAPLVVVDAEGRRVTLDGPVRRIVSLVPSATRTLDAIGARNLIVGRTDFDVQAWAADIPSVGGGLEPSLESLVALRPDLVVRFGGGQDARTAGRLDDLGIPYLTVRPDALADIWETAAMLGAVTGRAEAADSLTATLREGLAEVAASVADRPRVRFAYVLGGTPPWVGGAGTYISEVVELAGGDNVFSDLGELYAPVSPEELRAREIDVVLVSAPEDHEARLTPGARVVSIGDVLEIPGPGVVEAARRVAALLHGAGAP